MAIGDTLFLADKATLDQVKTNTDQINSKVKTMRSAVFKTPGTFTWTAPANCTEVYATGTGAGGGGAGAGVSIATGNTGGTTSFDTLLSLIGGSGGGNPSGGLGAGSGGDGSSASLINGGSTIYHIGGTGGSGFGIGGGNSGMGTPSKGGLGSGGQGGYGGDTEGTGGGGGAGDYVYGQPLTVTPNTAYTITVGDGGTGGTGTGDRKGAEGGNGYMLIEWWE